MKNIYTLCIGLLLFSCLGTVLPVNAIDVSSVDKLVAKPLSDIQPTPQETDRAERSFDTRPSAPVITESKGAANLLVHQTSQVDDRSTRLKAFLVAKNSPLASEATHFIEQADKYNLDWKFVAAICGVESTFGKFIPVASYNGWGWGIPTGAQHGIVFKNWEDGISQVSNGLRTNYINRGAITIEQIGRIYAASPTWSWKVHFFMDQIENFSPNSPQLLQVYL